jgi:hypothetical protein
MILITSLGKGGGKLSNMVSDMVIMASMLCTMLLTADLLLNCTIPSSESRIQGTVGTQGLLTTCPMSRNTWDGHNLL